MFKSLMSFLCCMAINSDQSMQDQQLARFSSGLINNEIIKQVTDFEAIRAQFLPEVLRTLAPEVQEVWYKQPSNAHVQFINRYMNAIMLRLALIPADERVEALQSIPLLIPASEAEYTFIQGNYRLPKPASQYRMGKTICWPLEHTSIQNRIAHITAELQSKKRDK